MAERARRPGLGLGPARALLLLPCSPPGPPPRSGGAGGRGEHRPGTRPARAPRAIQIEDPSPSSTPVELRCARRVGSLRAGAQPTGARRTVRDACDHVIAAAATARLLLSLGRSYPACPRQLGQMVSRRPAAARRGTASFTAQPRAGNQRPERAREGSGVFGQLALAWRIEPGDELLQRSPQVRFGSVAGGSELDRDAVAAA